MVFRGPVRTSLARLGSTATEAPCDVGSFEAMRVPPSLVEALSAKGIESPTAIQSAAIGPLLAGASGMLAAETGSGKSVAFLVPSLARLEEFEAGGEADVAAGVLVLAPTRELALQLAADAAALVGDEALVQLLVVGAATTADALKQAKVIVATPKETKEAFGAYGVLGKKAAALGAVILDEVDALLPPKKKDYRTAQTKKRHAESGKKKKMAQEAKQAQASPAEDCVRFVVKANPRPELQVVAASARAGKGCENPNFKGSYLGRFSLVSADFSTSDHLSERSRSVNVVSGTRARGTPTLKRR